MSTDASGVVIVDARIVDFVVGDDASKKCGERERVRVG